MKQFLIIIYQAGEGCDYTIGCGLSVSTYEAASAEEAFNKWADDHDMDDSGMAEYYINGEGALESVQIYEIGSEDNEHLWRQFVKMREQQIRDAKNQAKKDAELAEYERLRAKFEK